MTSLGVSACGVEAWKRDCLRGLGCSDSFLSWKRLKRGAVKLFVIMTGFFRTFPGQLVRQRSVVPSRLLFTTVNVTGLRLTVDSFAVSKRFMSMDTGENKTGHIKAGPNEGILFFDSEKWLKF
jgi:hypothetical protein